MCLWLDNTVKEPALGAWTGRVHSNGLSDLETGCVVNPGTKSSDLK